MKNILVLSTVLLTAVAFRNSAAYLPTDEGSEIKFKIKNLGITVDGTLKGLNGLIEFDPANPTQARFDVAADANSINTGIRARDNHLRKEDYFNVLKYPAIKFSATKVTSTGTANNFMMYGNLTIKNVTKAISFPFTVSQINNGLLFKGEFKIDRRDYAVGGNSMTLSDNVSLFLSVFAKAK